MGRVPVFPVLAGDAFHRKGQPHGGGRKDLQRIPHGKPVALLHHIAAAAGLPQHHADKIAGPVVGAVVVGILLYIFRPFVGMVIMSFTDFFSDYTIF